MFERINGKATRIKATYVKPICTCSICQSKPASNVGCQNGAPAVCQIPKDRGGIFQGADHRRALGCSLQRSERFCFALGLWGFRAKCTTIPNAWSRRQKEMTDFWMWQWTSVNTTNALNAPTWGLQPPPQSPHACTCQSEKPSPWSVEKPCDGGTRCWLLPADCSLKSDTELSSFQAPAHNRSAKRSKKDHVTQQ